MKKMNKIAVAGLAVGLMLMPGMARATDQTDLSVGLKTLPLLTNKITGSANMGVVYDPANEASKAEAQAIKGIVDGGLEAPGGVKLTATLVGVGELDKLSQTRLAFVTGGLKGAQLDAVNAAASGAGVLTISTDLECVKGNKCVLGVVSKPNVEIYYSRAAAESAKIGFAQAFTMLVKQF